MTDHSRAVFVIAIGDKLATFCIRNNLTLEGSFTRDFLLGDRGGILNEVARRLDSENNDAREGFFLDSGQGAKRQTLSAELVANSNAADALQMGDGSSDPTDPDDTTQFDATGSHPVSQAQVFDYVVSEARTDSDTPARLHIGEWSDGTQIEAGAFGRPLDVVIKETEWRKAEDDASTVRYTVTVQTAASFEQAADAIVDGIENLDY